MTRAAQAPRAVGPRRRARAAASTQSESVPLTFRVFKDNAGAYHWAIIDTGGETLSHSAGYVSHEEAERAARIVHRHASRASFEGAPFDERSGETAPIDLPAHRRAAQARDARDAERWLDEGGSFSSQAVSSQAVAR